MLRGPTRRSRNRRGRLVAVEIRIEGSDLPGRDCPRSRNFPGYGNIHVGVQRRRHPDELLGLTPGDAPAATWTFTCDVIETANGVDFKSTYVEGRPHERFIYLSWGSVSADGSFDMFRRAKLWLDAIDPGVLDAARRSRRLVGRLGLSDTKGEPLCASVRPPRIVWSAE